jgi:hypothetical protein
VGAMFKVVIEAKLWLGEQRYVGDGSLGRSLEVALDWVGLDGSFIWDLIGLDK